MATGSNPGLQTVAIKLRRDSMHSVQPCSAESPAATHGCPLVMSHFLVSVVVGCGLLTAAVVAAEDLPPVPSALAAPVGQPAPEASPGPRRPVPVDRRDFDPRPDQYRTRDPGAPPRAAVSSEMQDAIETVQSEHGGKVLSADRIHYRGQDTYRIKLLTGDGRVRVVQITQPAADGTVRTERFRSESVRLAPLPQNRSRPTAPRVHRDSPPPSRNGDQ